MRFARLAAPISLIVAAACARADAEDASARPFKVGTADRGDIRVTVEETGIVEPERQIVVKSPISGVVQSLSVREGDRVRAGQALARIVPDIAQANSFAQLKSEIAAAEIQVANARREHERAQELAKSGSVTQSEMDSRRVAYQQADNALRTARSQLQLVQRSGVETGDRQFAAITAPSAGVIIARGVEVGETVVGGTSSFGGGTELFTIADLSTLLVKAAVNEVDIGKVRAGEAVALTVDAFPGDTVQGTVRLVPPGGTPQRAGPGLRRRGGGAGRRRHPAARHDGERPHHRAGALRGRAGARPGGAARGGQARRLQGAGRRTAGAHIGDPRAERPLLRGDRERRERGRLDRARGPGGGGRTRRQPVAAMTAPLLSATGLTKTYRLGRVDVPALRGVDVTVERGEFIAITGPSGSGKSTLMHILGCLDTPTSGRYALDGEDVAGLRGKQLAQVRNRKVGFVFQTFNLMPRLTVEENVALPLKYRGGLPRAERRHRALALLERLGLDDRVGHRPDELSGGQRQRVAIARALIGEPAIVMADEPTGNLDSQAGANVLATFDELNRAGHTLILVTHDPGVASRAQRIVHISDGKVV